MILKNLKKIATKYNLFVDTIYLLIQGFLLKTKFTIIKKTIIVKYYKKYYKILRIDIIKTFFKAKPKEYRKYLKDKYTISIKKQNKKILLLMLVK